MRRFGIARLVGTAALAVGGLAGAGGLIISGALPASAIVGCGSAPTMCMKPAAGIANDQVVKVVVKTAPSTQIAVTECNANLAIGDANACDSNPSQLGKPGGPALAETNATGTATLEYKVRVSATKAVGDGVCAPGGNECFLIAASVSTMQPVAPPVGFTTEAVG